jgi:hypothetical protein
MAVLAASKKFGVPRSTLLRRVGKKNHYATGNTKELGSFKCVFNAAQEAVMINHIIKMEERFFGMTAYEVREMAFQLAVKNKIKHPFKNGIAGVDWLHQFRKRHPEISLRTPEATSLARARAFNRVSVEKFFKILGKKLDENKYTPHQIFNVDETSMKTVPSRNSKILAKKGR